MKIITVKHEVSPGYGKCSFGGDFWGKEVCKYHALRKASWKNYASQGWVPLWLYFVKFEGMSEEEAKKMVAEASAAEKEKGLFDQR